MKILVGMRIKQLREQFGMTQKELADKLSVSREAVTKYESGIRQVNLECLVEIATLFNVSTDYLLGLTNYARVLC